MRDGRYGNASEYVRDLIRRDQDRRVLRRRDELEHDVEPEMTDADWELLRIKLAERAAARHARRAPPGDD